MQVSVLLVEDDEDDYILVENAISAYPDHFQLFWAQNYLQAMEQIKEKEFDVCLIDFRLGEKTGLDLIKESILMGFSGALIILTGLGYQAGIDEKAMAIGADDYLAKEEISPPLLKRTILFNIQRKKAEARIRESESRFRQIAEISSNTLHNIGNVLNSLNITNQTAESLLKKINPERLEDVANMLGNFSEVQEDAKGKLIAPYLLKVQENLNDGIHELAFTLHSSMEKLQLAREAIRIQHKTMRSGKKEWASVSELIQEALSLHRVRMTRHQIESLIDDPQRCEVFFHRTTLLHILINLIKNAIEAMHDNPVRKITVKIFNDGNQVTIRISDTGVGMTAETLEKLFSHGFTTKSSGNGFGLHFCRQVLEKEGGSIRADSKGIGEGSCFEMTLPVQELIANA